ncbi:NADPH-dependent FMN reductase [Candidatus Termititenax aidoneus]|uniref:NADPH-dependent FMN reductase n=1 Tax=Termititenax aidoneus TaxID=2218524 RepID=A0A388TCA5_TERA1|nr:NADPH-dependent FMN reductase [Candidatus Termititenax aidoneus]
MSKLNIGVFVGSLRRESFSRKIAKAVAGLLPEDFQSKLVDIGGLSLYNQDEDTPETTPPAWVVFRQEVKALDGLLFVTPEYNRSVTPVLKNALDIASRPYGQNVWSGKPGVLISVSPGQLGAFGAYHHLQQTMAYLNIILLNQPEVYISNVPSLLDAKGEISNPQTQKFLQTFAAAFAQWVRLFPVKQTN